MIKYVCPVCGYSDFLVYDNDDSVYCLCCGFEYTVSDLKLLEKDVPDEEYDGNGITYIDTEKEARYNEFMEHFDEHYANYVKNKSLNVEDKKSNINSNRKDRSDESCPF